MDTWQFYQNEKSEWCWKHVAATGVHTRGAASFSSRTDCIADAMRHGYLSSTTVPFSRVGEMIPIQYRHLRRA